MANTKLKALVIVDLQKDFLPGGARPVAKADTIVPLVNLLQPSFKIVVASQNWLPAIHTGFSMNHAGRSPGETVTVKGRKRKLRAPFCVQHTDGAKLAPNLQMTRVNKVFQEGIDAEWDSRSAFFDEGNSRSTGLAEFLKAKKIEEIYVLGVATEERVKYTVLDGLALGLKVFVIEDACRARESGPEAFAEMTKAGAKLIRSRVILEEWIG